MKTVQKLEIAAGIATLVSSLAYFCVYWVPYIAFKYENYGAAEAAIVLIGGSILFLLPGVITGIAAYLWATTANVAALVVVVCVAPITGFMDFLLVAGVRFYRHDLLTLLILTPLIFPALTVVFAFGCRKAFAEKNISSLKS